MIKPTVKSMTQLPKTRQAQPTVHSEYNARRSEDYHQRVVSRDSARQDPVRRMNPTRTKPNELTVTQLPGLAN